MKILIITPYFPYPLNSGGSNAQYLMIDYLRTKMDITMVCSYATQSNIDILKAKWPNVEIHIIDKFAETYIPPQISKSKQFKRYVKSKSKIIRFILKSILGKNSNVKAVSVNNVISADSIFPDKQRMQFTQLRFDLEKNLVDFVIELTQKSKFDIIQTEFINLLSLGMVLPIDVKKVFIHHEIGFIRTEREQNTLKLLKPYDIYLSKLLKKQEIDFLHYYDSIITFSDTDKAVLSNYIDNEKIIKSQFAVKQNKVLEQNSFQLQNLLYLGGENHYPNKDAFEWFVSDVYPLINQEFTNLKFKIIGDWSQTSIIKHQPNSNIEFLGYVDDLYSAVKNCVLVVPLRIGSGIRAKILDAFSLGIPLISSSIGIEGIPAVNGVHYLKADTSEEYISALNKLTKKPGLALQLAQNAQNDILPQFSIQNCGELRFQSYLKILNQNA